MNKRKSNIKRSKRERRGKRNTRKNGKKTKHAHIKSTLKRRKKGTTERTRAKSMKNNKTTTKKNKQKNRSKVYTKEDFSSGDGMLTSVWGPALWHYLHTMSFNYPVKPTLQEKRHYRDFILNLKYVLPCKYCRMNLRNNFKALPLTMSRMKNRETFSRYIYELHEHINKMLGKVSGLSYEDVRIQYEDFRARCTIDPEYETKVLTILKTPKTQKEKGCSEPLYGKKSKCVIKIVPQSTKCKTFEVHEKCKKHR